MEKIGMGFIDSAFKSFLRDLIRCCDDDFLQLVIVSGGHVRESRTKSIVVTTAERILTHAVQMIADQHQPCGQHIGAKASCGIRENDILDPHPPKGAHRERNLIHVVAFVEMEPALLNCDWNAAAPTE